MAKVTEKIEAIQREAKTPTSKSDNNFTVRFFVNDQIRNDRAPVAFAEIELGPRSGLAGMLLRSNIFAQKDARGQIQSFSATLPGQSRYGNAFESMPVYVTDAKGKVWPVKGSKDPNGARIEQTWSAAILTAYHKFCETGDSIQTMTI